MTIPLDIGIRPSFVQWIGLFYLGIGVSFVGGFYLNQQDDEELNADDSFGRFDGFILYNFGGGTMFDIGEKCIGSLCELRKNGFEQRRFNGEKLRIC